MVFVMMTQGNLISLAELDDLDCVSLLIAGVCHDYAHDGYNNAFHVNAITPRAIRYNDASVQENYHAAESF